MIVASSDRQNRHIDPATWPVAVRSTVLAVAGAIHLILMPEHLAGSPVLGIGFFAAGIAQLSLSALVVVWGRRIVLVAVIAVSLDTFGAGTQAAQIAAIAIAVYILRRARVIPTPNCPTAPTP